MAALDQIVEKADDPVAKENVAEAMATTSSTVDNSLPDLDILHHDDIKKWLHFDVVETEKLEWMRDLPANLPAMKPGESYEAR